ncbi:5-hydroxytryptamine receptor 1A-like [Mytilus californianus]|uniref:5-hydroxytryptamine receptor 1A-like n=1 Tax=Mytilus californianus TaxID=6549 RepID=UPI002245AC29|nr:5-hydroxytryptamine receptor 1A-like [Mytilus californianus]
MNTSIIKAIENVTEDLQSNATNYQQDWPKTVETYLIGNSVFLAVCMVIGVIGNAIVVAVYKLEMKDTSTERYFIPVLAAADILATIVGSITCTIWNSLQSSFTSNSLCKVILFSIASSASLCLFLFLCIAFQRYLLICRKYQLNLLQRRIMIGISAILGICMAIPFTLTYGINEFSVEGRSGGQRCGRLKREDVYPVAVAHSIVFGIIMQMTCTCLVFFYGRIGCTIFGHFKSQSQKKKMQFNTSSIGSSGSTSDKKTNEKKDDTSADNCGKKNNSSSQEDINFPSTDMNHHNDEALQRHIKSDRGLGTQNMLKSELQESSVGCAVPKRGAFSQSTTREGNDKRNKRNKRFKTKFSLMFVVVTSVSIVCYLPVGAIVMLEGFIPEFWDSLTQMELIVVVWFYRSYIINSIANPIIYAFLDVEFYNGLQRLYQRCFKK